VTAGISSIVMPSAVEAAAALPRVEESEVCTVAAVVVAGTAMVAVMSTLPAVTAMVTSDLSTPAAVAMPCRKLEVSEWSPTLPLAVSLSTIVSVEGGSGDGGDGGGGGGGGEGGGDGGGGDDGQATATPPEFQVLSPPTYSHEPASSGHSDAS
jgi:uncharacterized membrane protein YgcG